MQLPSASEIKDYIITGASIASLGAITAAILVKDWKHTLTEVTGLFAGPENLGGGLQCAIVFIPFDASSRRSKADQFQAGMQLAELIRQSLERAAVGTQKGFQRNADGITLLICGSDYNAVLRVIHPVIEAYAITHSSKISIIPNTGSPDGRMDVLTHPNSQPKSRRQPGRRLRGMKI